MPTIQLTPILGSLEIANRALTNTGIIQEVRPQISTQAPPNSEGEEEQEQEEGAEASAEVPIINDSQVGGRLQLFADNWLLGSRWQKKVVKSGLKWAFKNKILPPVSLYSRSTPSSEKLTEHLHQLLKVI